MRLNERVIIAIERQALARAVLKRCREAEVVAKKEGNKVSTFARMDAADAALEQMYSAEAEYNDVLAGVEDRALAADADWQKARLWRETA